MDDGSPLLEDQIVLDKLDRHYRLVAHYLQLIPEVLSFQSGLQQVKSRMRTIHCLT